MLGFNNMFTFMGHFESSPRERGKRDGRDSRGDERVEQGRKTEMNESEGTEKLQHQSVDTGLCLYLFSYIRLLIQVPACICSVTSVCWYRFVFVSVQLYQAVDTGLCLYLFSYIRWLILVYVFICFL